MGAAHLAAFLIAEFICNRFMTFPPSGPLKRR
jgi:hypothetical protein